MYGYEFLLKKDSTKKMKIQSGGRKMIFYIADMHFGHENVIHFDNRPFADTTEMEKCMISNWNLRVTKNDTVYILGDAFWKNEEQSIKIITQLKGHKILIKGNHDRVSGQLKQYYDEISDYAEIRDSNHFVILSHYPIIFYKNQHRGSIMLYGHLHNTKEWDMVEKWKQEQLSDGISCNLINVGCMMSYMNYMPRTLDEILKGTDCKS